MAHALAPGTTIDRIPRPIRRALGRIDRRLRTVTLLRGVGLAALIGAIGAMVGMGLDVGWILPEALRWGIWGAWVIAVGGLIGRALGRSLGRNADGSLALAAVIERAFPELGERLTGIVGLVGERSHGSSVLINALADDAAGSLAGIAPDRAVPMGKSARWLGLGVIAIAMIAAPAILKPEPFGTIARRFFMPWLDLERVGRLAFVVTPGDTAVALGDDLAISVEIAPRLGVGKRPEAGEVWLEWTDLGTGRTRKVVMAHDTVWSSSSDPGARAFVANLAGVTGPLAYRVVIDRGNASRKFRVQTLPAPGVARLAAQVEPPAYMKLPTTNAPNPDRLEVWEGSRVALEVFGTSTLRSLAVVWPNLNGRTQQGTGTVAADGLSGRLNLTALASGDYAIKLVDTNGLTNRTEPMRRVIVQADQKPRVVMNGMEGLDEAKPDDTLSVKINASDDFAVATAELHYKIERSSTSPSPLPDFGKVDAVMTGLDSPVAKGTGSLGIEDLRLNAGDVLTYRVKVTDNKPIANETWTPEKRLTMVEKTEPLATRRGQLDRANAQAKLDALKTAATTIRRETEPLRYAADAAQRGNGQWDEDRKQALEKRETEAKAMADSLRDLARELATDPIFHPLAESARKAANVEAEAARETLDQARRAPDDAKRLGDLRLADSRLGAVSERLEELQRDLNARSQRELDRQKLGSLADRQAKIGDKLDDLPGDKPDRAQLDQVRAQQNQVRNELDNLLKSSPTLKAEILAEQTKHAEDLAKQARDLADRQRQQARAATDLTAPAKMQALKRLADDQRQIETDARKLALDIDQPLQENYRNKVNVEAMRKPVDPIERGEVGEARQKLQEGENELRKIVRDLEDAPKDAKARANRLVQKQDQLTQAIHQAIGDLRSKSNVPADEQAAFAESLKPLLKRQEELAKQVATIKPDGEVKLPKEPIERANKAIARTVEGLKEAKDPKALLDRSSQARDAMHRLSNELPDQWKLAEPNRKALDDARHKHLEVIQGIERHLRETDKPNEPAKGLADLSNRIAPLANRSKEVADSLEKMKPTARVQPQRDRAVTGAKALAKAIEKAREDGAKATGFEPEKAKAIRDQLANSALEARLAFDRLDQKTNGQMPADDLAAELLEDQRALRDQSAPKSPMERLERLEDQRRLAAAMRNLQAHDAPVELADAIRQADLAAKALAEPKGTPEADKQAIARAAEAAETLSKRLGTDPRKPEANPPRDPDLAIQPEHVARARDLALRERRLRENLQAVLGEAIAPQDQIQQESKAIGEKLAELRDKLQGLSDRARGPADEASRLLTDQAPQAMADSANRLGQGEPAQARDAQRRAAQLVERGAQQADDLAATLRAEKGAAMAEAAEPNPLGAARDAMAEAGEQLGQAENAARQAAAKAMRTAANQLRAAATPPASGMAQADPSPSSGEPKSNQAGVAQAAELKELQNLIQTKTGRAWGELPGHLRTEILQMSQGRYRDDYARLIQLYFREIAEGQSGEPK